MHHERMNVHTPLRIGPFFAIQLHVNAATHLILRWTAMVGSLLRELVAAMEDKIVIFEVSSSSIDQCNCRRLSLPTLHLPFSVLSIL
jgi:hypothetical protein